MALATCRECGREVSTEASACPHCGARDPAVVREGTEGTPPPKSDPGMTSFKIIIGGCLGLVVAAVLILIFVAVCTGGVGSLFVAGTEKVVEGVEKVEERETARVDSILSDTLAVRDTVDTQRLLDAYRENSVAAADRFEGRALVVRGTMKRVGGDADRAYIYLDMPEYSMTNFRCTAVGESARAAARLTAGEEVLLLGVFEGEDFMNLEMENCRVL